jgi:3-hydroxyacyl-[acyl-carrier-protein] dehydratase
MLMNDLFIVNEWRPGDGTLTATFHLPASHRIFEGHFPGRPVVPGACLVELVREMAGSLMGEDMLLIRADQVKFIKMIVPVPDGSVTMTGSARDGDVTMTVTGKQRQAGEWQAGEWQVVAEALYGGSVCFRFRGIFRAGSGYAG